MFLTTGGFNNAMRYEKGEGIIAIIVVVAVLIAAVYGIYKILTPDRWTAFYETSSWELTGTREFESKNECLNWIHDQQLEPLGRYNFECGSNCRTDSLSTYICDETID